MCSISCCAWHTSDSILTMFSLLIDWLIDWLDIFAPWPRKLRISGSTDMLLSDVTLFTLPHQLMGFLVFISVIFAATYKYFLSGCRPFCGVPTRRHILTGESFHTLWLSISAPIHCFFSLLFAWQILKPADKKKFPYGAGGTNQRPVTPMRGGTPKNPGKMWAYRRWEEVGRNSPVSRELHFFLLSHLCLIMS